jgi:rhamnosyltransferase
VSAVMSRPSVCAVVVAYHPDAGFAARLAVVRPQVDALVIIDNTPHVPCAIAPQAALQTGFDATDGAVRVIGNAHNLGIATALNQGLAEAARLGCDWTLTLDQDTHCRADMVETLLAVAIACTPAPAIIGGNYYDHQNRRLFIPQAAAGHGSALCEDAKTVITSGSLVDTRFALDIGGFRDDYFIDQVDHEFCLRARMHGRRIVISRQPVMDHSVGLAGGARLPFLGILPNHPPVRKYYITRNTFVTVGRYWRQEPVWCLRRMARLILGLLSMMLLEQQGMRKARAFGAGMIDGLRGRMGPCTRTL